LLRDTNFICNFRLRFLSSCIDYAGESYTIVLKEAALEDGNNGETYEVTYDEQGKTAEVKDNIFWQYSLVDKNQQFEFYGDKLNIYQRTHATKLAINCPCNCSGKLSSKNC
jgi:hypothetical protein